MNLQTGRIRSKTSLLRSFEIYGSVEALYTADRANQSVDPGDVIEKVANYSKLWGTWSLSKKDRYFTELSSFPLYFFLVYGIKIDMTGMTDYVCFIL